MTLSWAVLVGAILTSLAGQTLLKSGSTAPDFQSQLLHRHTLIGLCLYAGAALLYILALRRIPMSVALPCTAISYVAAAAIGHFAFAEPIGAMQVGALTLISVGVVLLAMA